MIYWVGGLWLIKWSFWPLCCICRSGFLHHLLGQRFPGVPYSHGLVPRHWHILPHTAQLACAPLNVCNQKFKAIYLLWSFIVDFMTNWSFYPTVHTLPSGWTRCQYWGHFHDNNFHCITRQETCLLHQHTALFDNAIKQETAHSSIFYF